MTLQKERYRLKSGDDIGNPTTLNARFFDLDLRLHAQEQIEKSWVEAMDQLQRIGLARIDEVLMPVFNKIAELAQLGAMFTATSPTEVEISVGLKRLIIDEASREMYAPAAFVACFVEGNLEKAMLGTVRSYDIASGELELDVHRVSGTGSGADWVIHAASATDNAEAAAIAVAARDVVVGTRDDMLVLRDYVDTKHDETDAFRTAAASSAALASTKAVDAETALAATVTARDQALAAVTSVTVAATNAITTVNTTVATAQAGFQADIDAAEAELTATVLQASTNLQNIIDDGTASIDAAYAAWPGRYLGAFATDPSTGFGGAPLVEGELYWNTVDNQIKAYDGVGWTAMVVPVGSEVVSAFGRTGAVTAQAGDYNAQKITFTPAGTIAATNVQAALEEVAVEADAKLTAGLAGKAETSHTHAIADITALQATLDGKAAAAHTHDWLQVTGTPTSLAGYNIAIASTAEAQAGTDNTKPMTAQRVAEALPTRVGAAPAAVAADWNTLASAGWYTLANGQANQPAAGFNWSLLVLPAYTSGNFIQVAVGCNSSLDDIHMRERVGATYGPWRKLQWTQIEQDARYARLTGPTFTGSVTISTTQPLLVLNETDAAADARRWQFSINGGVFEAAVTDDAIATSAAWLTVTRGAGNGVAGIDLQATALTKNGNVVWHAGNDGATSGLDADLLDGVEGSAYARADASNIGGRLGANPNVVSGSDWNTVVATGWHMGSTTTSNPLGADTRWWIGTVVQHDANWITQELCDFGDSRKVYRRDKRGGTWQAWVQVAAADGKTWHPDNDGAGSGLDADTVDGMHAGDFAPMSHTHDDRYYTETEINTLLAAKANSSHTHSEYLGTADKAADASRLNGAVDATAATASTIAKRDAGGHLVGNYLYGVHASVSHTATQRTADTSFFSTADNFVRKNNAVGFRTSLSVYSKAEVDALVADGPTYVESAELQLYDSPIFAHGLGVLPKKFGFLFKCVAANNGYSIGDRLVAYGAGDVVADATSVTWLTSGSLGSFNKSNFDPFTLTTANWRLIIWAEE